MSAPAIAARRRRYDRGIGVPRTRPMTGSPSPSPVPAPTSRATTPRVGAHPGALERDRPDHRTRAPETAASGGPASLRRSRSGTKTDARSPRTDSIRSPKTAYEKCFLALRAPLDPCDSEFSSLRSMPIASATATGSTGSTSKPVSPSSTTSGTAPDRPATTGTPPLRPRGTQARTPRPPRRCRPSRPWQREHGSRPVQLMEIAIVDRSVNRTWPSVPLSMASLSSRARSSPSPTTISSASGWFSKTAAMPGAACRLPCNYHAGRAAQR